MTKERIKLIPNEHSPNQTGGWHCEIKGIEVSIVKWQADYYDGDYEIWSNENLFRDVERYKTMDDVMKRLEELNK